MEITQIYAKGPFPQAPQNVLPQVWDHSGHCRVQLYYLTISSLEWEYLGARAVLVEIRLLEKSF